MTRLDQWFSTLFLGAAPPFVLSLLFLGLSTLFFQGIPALWPLAAGFALGVVLDITLFKHYIVMAYVCPRAILVAVAILYSAWLLFVLGGCPVANVLVGPLMAWIIGRRRRLNDQTREHLRASLKGVMPWLLVLLGLSCGVGVLAANASASFMQGVGALLQIQPTTITILLIAVSALLLLLEYFLIRYVARKSYDHLFIAPISSL